MDAYRTLLVAVDFTAASAPALARAAQLAAASGAKVQIVHVLEHFPEDYTTDWIPRENEDPQVFLERTAREKAAELARQAGLAEASVEVIDSPRSAKHALVEAVEHLRPELLVLGRHGHSGPGPLLGGTAEGVLHRLSCDVLVVGD